MAKTEREKQNLGRAIQFFRKEKKLSQIELAALCDVSNISISKIENGISYPTSKLLFKIASSLSISVDILLNKAFMLDDSKLNPEKLDLLMQLKQHIENLITKELTTE